MGHNRDHPKSISLTFSILFFLAAASQKVSVVKALITFHSSAYHLSLTDCIHVLVLESILNFSMHGESRQKDCEGQSIT